MLQEFGGNLARFKSLEDIPMKNRKVFVTVQGLTTDQEGI